MTLLSWARLTGLLAGEAALVILLAGLLVRTAKPVWQRSIWHSVMVALVALLLFECCGAAPHLSKIFVLSVQETKPEHRVVVTTFPLQQSLLNTSRAKAAPAASDAGSAFNQPRLKTVWWPAWVWLTGAALFAMRPFVSQFWFLLMARRRRLVTDELLLQRISELSSKLDLRRAVRVTECNALPTPMVFGVFRFGLCLPEGFASTFTPAQHDAILAHELAHLSANDPAWYFLVDLVTALWWWNPFVWLSRRQLQVSTEQAADEASLLVEDGPGTLAECLVKIGRSLAHTRSFNLLGIEGNGFRSSLGRRVSRLLALEGAKPGTLSRGGKAFVHLAGVILLLLIVVAASGWTSRDESLAETAWKAIARKEPPRLLAQAALPTEDPLPAKPYVPRPPAVDPLTGLPTTNSINSESLHTRWFKVDPTALRRGLLPAQRAAGTNQLPGPMVSTSDTNSSIVLLDDLRNFLTSAGVDLSPPKTIFMNGHGMVMVRATLQDLDIVEQAMQVLNAPLSQITIESKFVEFPANSPLSTWLQNQGIALTANPLPADRSTTNASPPSALKALTPALYKELVKQAAEMGGTDILTPLKITTLDGRQAQMKVVDVKSVVTDLDYDAPTNGTAPRLQPIFEKAELGTVLDVTPYVSVDGYTISLVLIPSIKEFLGYDHENANKLGQSIPNLGTKIPLPMFRHRVAPSSAIVWDGQTVLLYLGSVVNTSKPAKPARHRLVLVTPTIIDPAGNPVHKDTDGPFRKTGTPPQRVSNP